MKRTAMTLAMAIVVSVGVARAQEGVTPAPASPVAGGKVIKAKTRPMTTAGIVKNVGRESLVISDASGRDWTFAVDGSTTIVAPQETVKAATVSPVEGGKKEPPTSPNGKETIDVTPASPIEGGKVIAATKMSISDVKEGQRVQVSYRTVDGKMHATQVKVM